MLMRTDPFRELDRLTEQLLGGQSGRTRPSMIPMDAYREGDRFVVHFDVPGVAADDVELTIEKNVLTVAARREWGAGDGVEIVVNERPQGTFTRQLFLGESLDGDRVDANLHDGVLTVTIPVAEQAKPRKVSIDTGAAGATAIDATSS